MLPSISAPRLSHTPLTFPVLCPLSPLSPCPTTCLSCPFLKISCSTLTPILENIHLIETTKRAIYSAYLHPHSPSDLSPPLCFPVIGPLSPSFYYHSVLSFILLSQNDRPQCPLQNVGSGKPLTGRTLGTQRL